MGTEAARFLADAMLGNVARDLRLLGYDAAFGGRLAHPELLHLAQSQRRILVTRDRDLARRARGLPCVLVAEPVPRLQVVEVLSTLGLCAPPERPFSRCLACNGRLKDLGDEEAAAAVPDHIAATARGFLACDSCGQVYWQGSHVDRLRRRVREVLGALHSPRARV